MRFWRLLKGGWVLEIFEVDQVTRGVTKVTTLQLRNPMTMLEAEVYVKDHYPL